MKKVKIKSDGTFKPIQKLIDLGYDNVSEFSASHVTEGHWYAGNSNGEIKFYFVAQEGLILDCEEISLEPPMKKVKIKGDGTYTPIQKLIDLGFENKLNLLGNARGATFYYNDEKGIILATGNRARLNDYEEIFLDNPIDKVTTTLLNMAFRMLRIDIDMETTDHIIDIVELLENKGDVVTIKDIAELQALWEK